MPFQYVPYPFLLALWGSGHGLCSQVTGGILISCVGVGMVLKHSQVFGADSPCKMCSYLIIITKRIWSVPVCLILHKAALH